ncbi:hypothetical protein HanIR_Chr04g0189401 [Helianthus annuus]|nr:hypothetical protein HanIR_Chr04g0189401 [Helianthus annuus]
MLGDGGGGGWRQWRRLLEALDAVVEGWRYVVMVVQIWGFRRGWLEWWFWCGVTVLDRVMMRW